MAVLRQVAREPDADDVSHLLVGNHLAAQRQDIRTIVFATVFGRSFVVAHRSADPRDLVSDHA
jgi:hypothetical protein